MYVSGVINVSQCCDMHVYISSAIPVCTEAKMTVHVVGIYQQCNTCVYRSQDDCPCCGYISAVQRLCVQRPR